MSVSDLYCDVAVV